MSIGLLGINYMDGFAKTSIIYATKTTESLSVFQGVNFCRKQGVNLKWKWGVSFIWI
jgi:hypothetical protein